jgi:hypothetical protein
LLFGFAAAKYDIGFSIEMDGAVHIPLKRHKAVEGHIFGIVKSIHNTPSQCILKWDNSYSKS